MKIFTLFLLSFSLQVHAQVGIVSEKCDHSLVQLSSGYVFTQKAKTYVVTSDLMILNSLDPQNTTEICHSMIGADQKKYPLTLKRIDYLRGLALLELAADTYALDTPSTNLQTFFKYWDQNQITSVPVDFSIFESPRHYLLDTPYVTEFYLSESKPEMVGSPVFSPEGSWLGIINRTYLEYHLGRPSSLKTFATGKSPIKNASLSMIPRDTIEKWVQANLNEKSTLYPYKNISSQLKNELRLEWGSFSLTETSRCEFVLTQNNNGGPIGGGDGAGIGGGDGAGIGGTSGMSANIFRRDYCRLVAESSALNEAAVPPAAFLDLSKRISTSEKEEIYSLFRFNEIYGYQEMTVFFSMDQMLYLTLAENFSIISHPLKTETITNAKMRAVYSASMQFYRSQQADLELQSDAHLSNLAYAAKYSRVLTGLELLRSYQFQQTPMESWVQDLETTVDTRQPWYIDDMQKLQKAWDMP